MNKKTEKKEGVPFGSAGKRRPVRVCVCVLVSYPPKQVITGEIAQLVACRSGNLWPYPINRIRVRVIIGGGKSRASPDQVPGLAIAVDIVSERFLSSQGKDQGRCVAKFPERTRRLSPRRFFIDGSSTALKNWTGWGSRACQTG